MILSREGPEPHDAAADSERNPMLLTRRQAIADVIVTGGGSVGYVIASFLSVPVSWIVITVVVVLGCYSGFVLAKRGHAWRDYGVRRDNLPEAARWVGTWSATAVALIALASIALGHSLNRPEVLILLAIYPLWGIVQQFVFQGILHRALMRLCTKRWVAMVLCALAFSSVHIADLRVVQLAFVGGLFWSWLYQRCPNLWTLGLSHASIGAFVYPWLLAENPLESFF